MSTKTHEQEPVLFTLSFEEGRMLILKMNIQSFPKTKYRVGTLRKLTGCYSTSYRLVRVTGKASAIRLLMENMFIAMNLRCFGNQSTSIDDVVKKKQENISFVCYMASNKLLLLKSYNIYKTDRQTQYKELFHHPI